MPMPKEEDQPLLIEGLPERSSIPDLKFRKHPHPLWTENKAKLIERYLYFFVMITHHGTYIDGFAGPQEMDKPEMWAAKLVLDNEPRWMRHIHLYDIDPNKLRTLEELKAVQPELDKHGRRIGREITVECGDFNVKVHELLSHGSIRQKEATFCLLDQRTFECKWSTVKALAEYKKDGENKIELFYFLPNSWLDRALAGLSVNKHNAIEWWGHDLSPEQLREMGANKRRDTMCERFKSELGYRHATPWPIYERADGGGAIMYYMIHATDHDEAPKLMDRAYQQAVLPKESVEQLRLLFPDADLSPLEI